MTLPGIACVYCGRRSSTAVCRGCAPSSRPTPLRAWLESSSTRMADLAADVGASRETIVRAAQGRPLRGPIALRVHRATGVPLASLLTGGRE